MPAPWQSEAQAASLQRLSPAIAALDQPALLDLLAPLSAQAARALLHLAATSPQELPALARQLLAQASAENRARLALALVQHWVAADGAPESRWVLKLLPGAADDRIVDVLSSAALAWHKTRKERAVVALQQLGRLDTVYALSCVQALATGKTLKPSVLAAAQAVLAEAPPRGMALADLGDELTPDFDLGRGVQLQVGAQTYDVLLQGDLSLRLRTPAGKLARSLPALDDEGLRTEWEAAAARLKTLSKGIKAVLQQQAPRLQSCLMLGRHWPLATWRSLFLEHPLLRVVAQGLVWRAEPAAGQPFSLRIAEDLSWSMPRATRCNCRPRAASPCGTRAGHRTGACAVARMPGRLRPQGPDRAGRCARRPAAGQPVAAGTAAAPGTDTPHAAGAGRPGRAMALSCRPRVRWPRHLPAPAGLCRAALARGAAAQRGHAVLRARP